MGTTILKRGREVLATLAIGALLVMSAIPGASAETTNNNSNNTTNLGELVILSELLDEDNEDDNNDLFGGDSNLGELIILAEVFGNNGGNLFGDGLFSGDSNLGELIVLSSLFDRGDEGEGRFDNLIELFLLSELFSQEDEPTEPEQPEEPTQPDPPADDDDDEPASTINFIRTGPLEQRSGVWILNYETAELGAVESNLAFTNNSSCTNVNGQAVSCSDALAEGAVARVTGNFTSSNNTVTVSTLRITNAAPDNGDNGENGDTVNFIRTGELNQTNDTWTLIYDTANVSNVESNLEFDDNSTCTNVDGETVNCTNALTDGATARVTGDYTDTTNTVNVSTMTIQSAPDNGDNGENGDTVNFIRTGELSQSGNTWTLTYDISVMPDVESTLSFNNDSTCTNADDETENCTAVLEDGATARVTGNYSVDTNVVTVQTLTIQ